MENHEPKKTNVTLVDSSKIKNLTALVIILVGLFVGSLFVDFVQLVNGSGFSSNAAKTHNVLQTASKTWVAYSDPKITVTIINDQDCVACNPDESLVWLRRVVPTLEATSLESNSDLGKNMIDRFQIKTLPAFVFSQAITKSDFYSQASSLFTSEGNAYFFNMNAIGLPIGKYLNSPVITDADSVTGPKDAKIKIVEFSDFQCLYCKIFHKDLMEVLREYNGKILFVFKHLPLSIHPLAENAALASACANEQGKFLAYADYLFANQADWGRATNTQKFKNYARYLKLNGPNFTKCLDTKRYQDKINADIDMANTFSVNGTPGTFINNTFLNGAVSADIIRETINKELIE